MDVQRYREVEGQWVLPLEEEPPKQDRWALRVAIVVIVLAVVGLFSSIVLAQEQGVGLICDEPEQVQSFIKSKGENTARIQAINAEAGKPACGVMPVIYTRHEQVNETDDGHHVFSIVRITVLAVHSGSTWLPVPLLVQYTMFKTDGSPA